MLATGELQNATMVKGITHGSKERVYAMLNDAQVAPRYMREGDAKRKIDKLTEVSEVLKKGKVINEKPKTEQVKVGS